MSTDQKPTGIAETIARYDQIARRYGDQWFDAERAFLPDFCSRLAPGDVALDLGCGPGMDTMRFRGAGFEASRLKGSR